VSDWAIVWWAISLAVFLLILEGIAVGLTIGRRR
jgi:hypothetical protein